MLAKITAWIPVATLFVMIVSVFLTLNPQFHFVGPNAPNLKVAPPLPHNVLKPILMPAPRRPSPDSEPEDDDTPTNVSITNSGRIGVCYSGWNSFPRNRPSGRWACTTRAHREAQTIPIVFRMSVSHRGSAHSDTISHVPMLIIGDDEWTVFARLRPFWPECAGQMLRGHLVGPFAQRLQNCASRMSWSTCCGRRKLGRSVRLMRSAQEGMQHSAPLRC